MHFAPVFALGIQHLAIQTPWRDVRANRNLPERRPWVPFLCLEMLQQRGLEGVGCGWTGFRGAAAPLALSRGEGAFKTIRPRPPGGLWTVVVHVVATIPRSNCTLGGLLPTNIKLKRMIFGQADFRSSSLRATWQI